MKSVAGSPLDEDRAAYKRHRRRHKFRILFCSLAGAFVFGAAVYACFCLKEIQAEKAQADAFQDSIQALQDKVVMEQESVQTIQVANTDEPDGHIFSDTLSGPGITIDFNALSDINTDIIAWLYIPDTYISFPVLQERVLMEYYYLDHDYTGERSAAGAIFTPAEPLGVEDAHLLLFGHRTRYDNVVFSGLHDLYGSRESGITNHCAYLIYPDRTEQYELWCAVESDCEDQVYEIPYQLETEGYGDLLSAIDGQALYLEGSSPDMSCPTMVLSTCNGRAGGKERFYVVFRYADTLE